jgi:signal peptidase II
MMKIGKGKKLLLLGILLVVIDQVIKVLVKVNLPIGGGFHVIGNWFRILFIENEGMAFGMKFGGAVGKFLLSFFRVCLFGFLFEVFAILWRAPRHKKEDTQLNSTLNSQHS